MIKERVDLYHYKVVVYTLSTHIYFQTFKCDFCIIGAL